MDCRIMNENLYSVQCKLKIELQFEIHFMAMGKFRSSISTQFKNFAASDFKKNLNGNFKIQ